MEDLAGKGSSKATPMPDLIQMSPAERASESVRNWKEISLKTDKIAKRKGFRFYHFLQPTLALSEEAIDLELFKRFFSERSYFDGNDYLAVIRKFYKSAESISMQFSHIHSITNVVAEESESYTDTVHYNDESNKAIADKICSLISGQRLKYSF